MGGSGLDKTLEKYDVYVTYYIFYVWYISNNVTLL